MSQSFPETEDSESARIGTAAHEVASKYLESYARGAMHNPKVGDICSNGVVIDDEMLECCELYADDVRAVMIQAGAFAAPFLGIEQRLEMPSINGHMFGTSDCFVFDAKNHALYVWDYKHGHDPVEAFENEQLISYAIGAIEYLKKHTPMLAESVATLRIVLRIVQPRSFHRDGPIREWDTSTRGIALIVERLAVTAEQNMSGTAPTTSGSHCKYCQARHGCESALNSGAQLYEVASQPLPLDMSKRALAVQLAIVMAARQRLKSIEDGLMQQVESMIRRGQVVPGFMAQAKLGRESWSTPLDEVFALGDMMGIDLRKPTAVTPKQAVKLGIDSAVISAYTAKTISGIEVVQESDKKLRLIFGVNEQ